MSQLDRATVAAANDTWVWAPEGSEIVETAEYRLARFPERFPDPLQVQWVRSARPAESVLDDIVARAVEFGLSEAYVYAKLSAPAGFDDALLARGARLDDTADVLAMGLPADVTPPDRLEIDVRWRTTWEVARDGNAVGTSIFGGSRAADDELARTVAAGNDTIAAGTGGAVVAYLDGAAVGVAGIEIAAGVARLWGGGVLESHRGRGVYAAMIAARLRYADEHGAAIAFTQGRVTTSSPILQRVGFVSYGQERMYRLPLK